jgi:hypothetical protein
MTRTPDTILTAGRRYLAQQASVEDCEPERDLLLALGLAPVGSVGHQRAVWLCWLAVRRVLERWGWPVIGPVEDVRHALALVDRWLAGAPHLPLVEWARACHVDDWCSGKSCQVGEEEYSFAVSGMVAALCRFALNGSIWDGVEVLQSAMFADAPYRERGFQSWLATVALPAAYELRQLSAEELKQGF